MKHSCILFTQEDENGNSVHRSSFIVHRFLRMKRIIILFCLISPLMLQAQNTAGRPEEVIAIIEKVNDYWQSTHPKHGNAFWHSAAYHTGNMAAYEVTGKEAYRRYSEAWAEANEWKGAKSDRKREWKYTYGETDAYVLFGDWQICFQTYIDLYNLTPDEKKIRRAREVMEYQMSTPNSDYWWWADGLYMVMPVMTKLYKTTGNELYLQKSYEYFSYAKNLMYDKESGLFFRDAKYVYPKHQTQSGLKDFWARGNGWVFAGLAKVLQDLPENDAHRDEYIQVFRSMATALIASQQPEGHWTRSLLDASHASGYETSGTAFFTYGLMWGINNDILDRETCRPAIEKAWKYLIEIALQADGRVGYVQPIGERADQHAHVGAETTADFGVGAFLLAASEMVHYLNANRTSDQLTGWAKNSVNTVIFRSNSIVSYGATQFIAYYNPDGYVCIGKRTIGSENWEIKQTTCKGNVADAHNCISIMVDGDGYLHVAWNHHNSPLNYTKSKYPLSLDLEEKQTMTGVLENKVTYPQFYKTTAGNLLFMYREGQSGKGNLALKSYNTKTKKWQQLHDNLIDGEGERNAYWQAYMDKNDNIHLSWVWRESPDVATNHDMCYARSSDGGKTWTNSNGIKYQLPITAKNAEYASRIPQNSELINQTSMTTDDKERPYIATYYRKLDSNIPQYHIIFLDNNNKWKDISLDFRKTPFTLSGQGTKKIPISRPQIICLDKSEEKQFLLIYRDEERESKITMAVCNDLLKNQWIISDLTSYSVGDWEPTYDTELWKNRNKLNLFVQKVEQGDGEKESDLNEQSVSVLDIPLFESRNEANDRAYWVSLAYKVAAPVLENMSRGELAKNMQVELSPTWDGRDKRVTYMECFGRLMDGIAPWLSLPDDDTPEGKQRRQLREWALKSYAHAVDPTSPDYLLWRKEGQPLVDAAYIASSFLRAPQQLWQPLDEQTKRRYIEEFQQLRRIDPPYTNWLLFSATVETFLLSVGAQHDMYRIHSAIRKIEEWYVGDGWYADGEHFAFDYYNSYVIQPMYMQVLRVLTDRKIRLRDKSADNAAKTLDIAQKRMQRYAMILERFISPEGTFPVFGRSMTYRLGVFQPLALLAWKESLPEELPAGQVRNALTQAMKRMFSVEGNFNEAGFLQLGFAGHQPELADSYTNNGSLYLTSEIFLPLGLPVNHLFWTSPAQAWTQKKAWNGEPFPKDHAYK
jgi:rhamnogalacturonyl hydrolase YesR